MATQQKTGGDAPLDPKIAEQVALDREQRRTERQALVAMGAADLSTEALRTSFLPSNMGEAMQFATIMAGSNFVPNHLRNKDGDCLAVLMISMRWGLDPFAVALKTYFVKEGAPPAFEGQLVNAVVNNSGVLKGRLNVEFEGEGERLRCTVFGYLKADSAEPRVTTQHIARITTRNSPLWKSHPEQQLQYYTTRAWARAWCPEVLLGVYTPDELDHQGPENARPITPPIPRRGATPDITRSNHDAATGEIIEQESQEEIDRRLDAEDNARRNGHIDDAVVVSEEISGPLANAIDAVEEAGDNVPNINSMVSRLSGDLTAADATALKRHAEKKIAAIKNGGR